MTVISFFSILFMLGNYQETLNDATTAVTLEPAFIKAIEKGNKKVLDDHLQLTLCMISLYELAENS